MRSRRTFIVQLSLGGATLLAGLKLAHAQSSILDEKDAQALALGYKDDEKKVDKTKFPNYEAGQKCADCSLYQGKPGDASGACPVFSDKLVAAKGWCSAWTNMA